MTGRCEIDGYQLEVSISRLGQTVVRCTACERRRSQRCQDCAQPVEGKAWRCPPCKVRAHQRTSRLHDRRNREERRRRERQRMRARPPEVKARRNAQKRAWREANKLKVKLQKRKGRLDGTHGYRSREAYLAAQAKQNARRVDRKRELMRELARERSPYRDHGPTCRQCGVDIPWNRRSRPRLDCVACRPMKARAA
jgi:hypothetical protein